VADLAGHLARGTWVIGEYLDQELPTKTPDFLTAAEYFAVLCDRATEDTYRAQREREASLVPATQEALVRELKGRLAGLEERLRSGSADRPVAVFAGLVIPLSEYLLTRIVEQVVHLDDLARSIGREPWRFPNSEAMVIALGSDIGLRRRGPTAMIRALYRNGFDEGVLPVL
jgi:hypothetical protein